MFIKHASEKRVQELEVSLRKKVSELRRKLEDPSLGTEERARVEALLKRIVSRTDAETRSVRETRA